MNFLNYQNVVLHRSGRMYTTHLDNSELTNHLFPYLYLQQNITHTVTITLSKAVQPQSKNYPQNCQYANPNNNNYSIIYNSSDLHIASLFLNNSFF